METIVGATDHIVPKMFKSYYVVWKQGIQSRITQPNAFKSYYVVWKRLHYIDWGDILCCLNRTM